MPAARMRALAALTRQRVSRNPVLPVVRDGPDRLPHLPKVRAGRNRRGDASHENHRLLSLRDRCLLPSLRGAPAFASRPERNATAHVDVSLLGRDSVAGRGSIRGAVMKQWLEDRLRFVLEFSIVLFVLAIGASLGTALIYLWRMIP